MSDPVAQAAAQIAADAAPSSTEPTGIIGEIVNEFHKLEEKVEHFIHPESAEVAQAGETAAAHAEAAPVDTSATTSASAAASVETQAAGESPNAAATPPAGAAIDASAGEAGNAGEPPTANGIAADGKSEAAATETTVNAGGEHPHTTILRNLTATLRRKFNVFDSEMETLLKDAESHL